jgi:hypothetical protein
MSDDMSEDGAVAERPASPIPEADVVTMEPPAITLTKEQDTEEYWIGLKAGAGFDFVTAGGMDFPRSEGQNAVDNRGQPLGTTRRGKRVHLTAARVEEIKASVARKVVRHVDSERAIILTTQSKGFVFRRGDEPLGRYLWMVRVRPFMPIDWNENDPPAMCD